MTASDAAIANIKNGIALELRSLSPADIAIVLEDVRQHVEELQEDLPEPE